MSTSAQANTAPASTASVHGATGKGPVGVAVIGAGNISKQYLDNLTVFPDLKVHVIADLFEEAAAARAQEYGIPEWGGVDKALNHPDVEIIVNLTIPAAHVEVATAAVNAGKHVWTEKPFSLDRESGLGLLKTAGAAGLRLGCAPDTFLGAGLQTALRMIRRGDIGTPLTAMTTFQTPGPESWHPNPAFLFQHGAGPLFDMGPYYLTTLIQAFGSIRKVAAVGSKSKDVRVIGSGPKAGEEFTVEVPTHVSAMAQFESGASSHSVFSFESPRARMGFVEITGTEATISLPDPNYFDGDIKLWRAGDEDWTTIPATGPANGRGLGVLDMARSIRAGVPHRATGELAYHVLDAMVSINESMESGTFVDVASNAPISQPIPEDWAPEALTLGEGA
ncbi:Gfo/Idh/MocA family protein [Arthrobacter sp. W4I7]|uniref:Gfo/Idh/MocA family protein n=1 Tax=Arthrobacter sp. W4I7 TaxID=3042296 RepID=UPI00278B7FD3|nr:Gfo/Idh/MocA family oxidoreductase [Arthrobacter sp. W4I7]MDQ0692579.1 putative dehydrogenase [Arthrobacter sp. W4I7]